MKKDKPIVSDWTKLKDHAVTLDDFGKRKVYVFGSTAQFSAQEQYEKLKHEAELNDCEVIEYKDHILIVINSKTDWSK